MKIWLVAGMLVVCGAASAQKPEGDLLVVVAQTDHAIVLVDPIAMQEVGRIVVGEHARDVAVSDDGTRAYVSHYGGGAANAITVVDLVTKKVTSTIQVSANFEPDHIAVSGGHLIFSDKKHELVGRLDAANSKVEWVLGLGAPESGLFWGSRDGHHILLGSSTLTFIDEHEPGGTKASAAGSIANWDSVSRSLGVALDQTDLQTDDQGQPVFLGVASKEGDITAFDISQRKLKRKTRKFHVDIGPISGLRMVEGNNAALVSSPTRAELLLVDMHPEVESAGRLKGDYTGQGRLRRWIPIGPGGKAIVLSPQKDKAFITCSSQNQVVIVDLKSFEVTGKIAVSGGPTSAMWLRSH